MNQFNAPHAPSATTLITASISAVILASIVLVTTILPAEYNIDPTGLGETLGLTQLSSTTLSQRVTSKQDSVNQAASAQAISAQPMSEHAIPEQAIPVQAMPAHPLPNHVMGDETVAFARDTVSIILPPHSGLEYKLQLLKGADLKYRWVTDSAPLYFDFHGEPAGDTTGYFQSFTESTANQVSGSLTAPFNGSHGWYWKNSSVGAVTVTLHIEGAYRIEGIK